MENYNPIHESFLILVRLGLGLNTANLDVFNHQINWRAMQTLADKQGLSAIVLDGIERLPAEMRPSKVELLQWIGETLQSESAYAIQWKAACEMSLIFDRNNIRTFILKGFVVSECYPKPEHRVSADLDCFLLNENHNDNLGCAKAQNSTLQGHSDAWELGNQLMEKAGFVVDRSFYKNSTVKLPGLTVENHNFMTAVRGSRRLKNLERLLQSWIYGDTELRRFDGTCMYRPPVMVSAMFLIEHAYAHFLHEGLTWRMILDWMMFSRKHRRQIDWTMLNALIDEYGFRKFYDTFSQLGKYLIGVEQEFEELSVQEKRMLDDVWADLDLHEFHGVKGKMALAGNEIRAAWKYHYFSPDMMITDLFRRVKGFFLERNPKI